MQHTIAIMFAKCLGNGTLLEGLHDTLMICQLVPLAQNIPLFLYQSHFFNPKSKNQPPKCKILVSKSMARCSSQLCLACELRFCEVYFAALSRAKRKKMNIYIVYKLPALQITP